MSEWRDRIMSSEWRARNDGEECPSNQRWVLEARVFTDDWEQFAVVRCVDMAGDSWSESIAEQMAAEHNAGLGLIEAGEDEDQTRAEDEASIRPVVMDVLRDQLSCIQRARRWPNK